MSFRLLPKSVTLNDLDWRHGPYFALFHRNRHLPGRTGRHCIEVVEDAVYIPKLSATEM